MFRGDLGKRKNKPIFWFIGEEKNRVLWMNGGVFSKWGALLSVGSVFSEWFVDDRCPLLSTKSAAQVRKLLVVFPSKLIPFFFSSFFSFSLLIFPPNPTQFPKKISKTLTRTERRRIRSDWPELSSCITADILSKTCDLSLAVKKGVHRDRSSLFSSL